MLDHHKLIVRRDGDDVDPVDGINDEEIVFLACARGNFFVRTQSEDAEIADIEAKYTAKIAEREIALKEEMEKAAAAGDFEKMEQLEKELVNERKKIQAELDEKKEKVRQSKR